MVIIRIILLTMGDTAVIGISRGDITGIGRDKWIL